MFNASKLLGSVLTGNPRGSLNSDDILISDIPDMPDYFGQSTEYGVELVYVPVIGAILQYQGKEYEVLQTATYRNELEEISHIMTCRDIDPNGDKDPIELYSDTPGISVA